MTYGGSHYKNQKELVLWFADQKDEQDRPLYNITCLIWKDNTDLKARDNLHLKRTDVDKLFDEKKVSLLTDLHKINEMLLPYFYWEASLLNERKYILDELMTENFDIAMIDAIYS